jgi:hypothetical protein
VICLILYTAHESHANEEQDDIDVYDDSIDEEEENYDEDPELLSGQAQDLDQKASTFLQQILPHLSEYCKAEFTGGLNEVSFMIQFCSLTNRCFQGTGTISEKCKAEMMGMLTSNDHEASHGDSEAESESDSKPPPKQDPRPTVLAFIGLILAGFMIFGVFAYYNLIPQMDRPVKKKSKQKILKEKTNESRRKHAGITR